MNWFKVRQKNRSSKKIADKQHRRRWQDFSKAFDELKIAWDDLLKLLKLKK